jgi:hypothetical protein
MRSCQDATGSSSVAVILSSVFCRLKRRAVTLSCQFCICRICFRASFEKVSGRRGRCSVASNRLIPAPAALEKASPQYAAARPFFSEPLRPRTRASAEHLRVNRLATYRCHLASAFKSHRGSPQRDGSRAYQCAPVLGLRSF